MSKILFLLFLIILTPRISVAHYEGTYSKNETHHSAGGNGTDDYYETGDATFKKITETEFQFYIHSSINNFSCETEERAVIKLDGKDARYKHKDGCDISFRFDDDWVYVQASEECNMWCGAHAKGSLNGMYYKIKASYDCTKATSDAEKVICSNKALADLDIIMNDLYTQLVLRLTVSDKKRLRQEQRNWIIQRDNKCSSAPLLAPCIEDLYKKRIELLKIWK